MPSKGIFKFFIKASILVCDNIFLTRRFYKDLTVEDMEPSPRLATSERTEISTKAPQVPKLSSTHISRRRRPRSSPVRNALSGSNSPERRARSPSVSATRFVLPDPLVLPAPTVLSPHDSLYTQQITPGVGPSATSYFSPQPPSMPLYIVPLPPNPSATAAQIEKNIRSQHQSKVKTRNKTVRKIVRHILYSLLKQLPISTENVGVDDVGGKIAVAVKETKVYPCSNRSIATQALSKYGKNRKCSDDENDECSISESSDGYEWAGSVRALRNSHVRLVLRQLRHLGDIERLSRALRREHAHE